MQLRYTLHTMYSTRMKTLSHCVNLTS